MAIQTLTVNVNAQPSAEDRAFLYLSQNENGRDIRFRVLGDDLPAGCTATLSGVKPDGNVWSKAGTVTNNFVTVEEDVQMTAVAGRWDAQLDIVSGSENIVTALIRITVEAAAVEAGAVPSDTQLEGYVEQCKQYAETAQDAQEAIENMSVSATTLAPGASATVTKTEDAEGIINLDFGLPLASGEMQVVNVTGSNPTITAEYNKRYVCGEVSTLTITPASQGCTDVVFTSGTTPTVLSLPQTVKMPSWFTVEASKTYEINILDGVYGAVMSWT